MTRGWVIAIALFLAASHANAAENLVVELSDERLTTHEAERVLLEADLPRRRRKRLRDSLSVDR